MANNYLEPTVNLGSPTNLDFQSGPAFTQMNPEDSPFESFLTDAMGTTQAFSYLAADGLAFANAENPSFGGTVVSTAISNFGNGATFGGGYGYGNAFGGANNGGIGGVGVGGGAAGGFPTNVFNSAGFGGGSGTVTGDGFSSGSVTQGMMDDGLRQIMLMAEVQQAARTLDAMSNIVTTKHQAEMNAIRNMRSN